MPVTTAQGSVATFYARELGAMRNRVARAFEAFKRGGMILVGDDGRRENEADLVFHASAATPELVNFAITHARGLLCVSLSHDLADRLAFASAPRLPGGVAHTGFTLSVDAREGITSGISAADRAHTIRLMADPRTQPSDFISPGHVFPVRANAGGLLARTGHTEALLEICQATALAPAAAMCEILAPDGEALRPHDFLKSAPAGGNTPDQIEQLRKLPYLSTVDLLWNRVFYSQNPASRWVQAGPEAFRVGPGSKPPRETWLLEAGLEEHISLNAALFLWSDFNPSTLRIALTNGLSTWDNGVRRENACGELHMFTFGVLDEPLSGPLHEFCDLSAKEGIRSTGIPVRRMVTQLRAFEFLHRHAELNDPLLQLCEKIPCLFKEDKEFIQAVLQL